jgi:ankyrin repeat protein
MKNIFVFIFGLINQPSQSNYHPILFLLIVITLWPGCKTLGPEILMSTGANDLPTTEILIGKGADVNHTDTITTPLYNAIKHVNASMVKSLITGGATPKENRLALINAYYNDNEVVILRDIRQKRSKVDNTTFLAKINDKNQIIKTLIENGWDTNIQNSKGITPLKNCALAGQPDLVKLLLKKQSETGRNHNAKPLRRGFTPLHYAGMGGEPETVKLLIDAGYDVNATTEIIHSSGGHWSALAFAVDHGNYEAVKILVENGADIDDSVYWGHGESRSLYELARWSGEANVMKYLMKKGMKATRDPRPCN